ncbi:helix-turn-helix transcriptional regulator [Mucilaginibacter sp. KACC 22773]|jgi:transcriptional regulator with XRE-family HTH domain|uniref:helix-turn-helix domain-containing protein n=1 Tax=Mucilaginibacter sp. KACC 22773 TaxID=3025671 RepID=UPI002365AB10|nr:helix-turn-helix transcriptional regulator [Mucilaginibacter sp. KACC 22773]WDF78410.1 helix-turn-helix transcriptional regulator [Mucilaginibacter sp. KACC 22773]
MDIRKKIGLRIKEYRTNLKLTQEALAFKAEIDKTYVNEVENGKRNVSVINLEKIIHALETDLKGFFDSPSFSEKVKQDA